jgi:tyrosyl-tRNA synthetase
MPSTDDQTSYFFRGTALEGETRKRMEDDLSVRLGLGRPLKVKLGLDPSKPFMHIGHLAPLLALKRFADLGHRTYVLLGGFTARLGGDPAGRKQRQLALSEDDVKANIDIYAREIFQVLDEDKTVLVNNATWFNNLRVIEFLMEAARVTLSKILEHKDFKDRSDAHRQIGLQELLYPVAQALDSMLIAAAPAGRENDPQAYAGALGNPDACCDVEVGGNDQLFNFTLTRELMADHSLSPQIFITTPLIQGRDKQKMGKGEENLVRFTDPPYVIYRTIMTLDDEVILPYLTSLTMIPEDELRKIESDLHIGVLGKHETKQHLAHEVVCLIQGPKKADEAEAEFVERLYGHVPPERDFIVPLALASAPVLVADLVFAAELIDGKPGQPPSKSQARRLVEQGGILIDGKRASVDQQIEVKDGMILQRGRGRDARVVRLRMSG